ncbi:hypothetical protein QEV83_05770 [Methylocapsa sp. D3K7]|uniref:hypothetical protein n=1 Tax=Methylocapsa sp. D3K7 TaxID=3041435 RepID=UPI00244EA089|nr:hypothetical protein [Methylocapsa sp. D3K7]WGJ15766.1 hypothetical protein QEV83_05770 [Methylocapsa sp. D3K7]
MVDTIFLRLSDKFALGADDLQWILYRSRREEPSPLDAPLKFGRGSEWLPVSFVRSGKDILLRCMREKGCKPCDEAKVALAMLPYTFDAWKAAGAGPNRPTTRAFRPASPLPELADATLRGPTADEGF